MHERRRLHRKKTTVCRSLFDSVRTKCIYIEPDESQKPKLVVIFTLRVSTCWVCFPLEAVSPGRSLKALLSCRSASLKADRNSQWDWSLVKKTLFENVSVSSGKLRRTYLYWTKHPSLSRLINRDAWLNLQALKWNTTLAQSKLFCRWWCFIFAHATQTVD